MGPGFPFGGGFDFTQLMRMLQSQGPVNFDIARQAAGVIATSDPETRQPGSGTPVAREATNGYAQLLRAAQTAAAETSGSSAALSISARTVDRHGWSLATIDALAPVLEALAGALASTPEGMRDALGD